MSTTIPTEQRDPISVSIPPRAHALARYFATVQRTPQAAQQTYLNTLAVYALHQYLQPFQFATALESSESWQAEPRPYDVADLVMPEIGRLECRPVLPGQETFSIPWEVTGDRIAYVVVRMQESLNEVELLGYLPVFDPSDLPESISIADIEPIDQLVEHLDRIEQGIEFLVGDDIVARTVRELLETQSLTDIAVQLERIYHKESEKKQPYAVRDLLKNEREHVDSTREISARGLTAEAEDTLQLARNLLKKLKEIWGERSQVAITDSPSPKVSTNAIASSPQTPAPTVSLGEMLENLRQRFHNLFEGGWLAPSMVLVPAYRGATEPEGSIKRAKTTDLGAGQAVALVIQLTPESNAEVGVSVQVYPGNNARYLPLGLQVIAIDESGATILEEQAESGADSIQLEFGIEPRERFGVRLVLGNVTVTEENI